MRRILLTRHGQTAWNAIGRLQGHTDIELDATGRAQARELGASLTGKGLGTVWTSDLARARETGAIVATALGLAAPSVDPDLRERPFGVFEGLTRDECATRHPEAWRAWVARTEAPPGGESRESAVARMTRALERLADGTGDPILVISHGGVMRLWLMDVLGAKIPLVANGATFVVERDGRGFRVSA